MNLRLEAPMEPFRFHLFVCTQQEPEGIPSCSAHGSLAVLEELRRATQALGLGGDVQVTACGCVGLCDEGPVVVVYPDGVWYRRVQTSDVPEIVGKHLLQGKPVERLIWKDAAAMKAMSVEHGEKLRDATAAREKAGMLPEHLEQMIRGYMPSRCILTALELDIFTAVGEGAGAEEIGARVHANARAVGMLLNALVALGLLSKSGEAYRNTPESARFFVEGSRDNRRNGLLHTANIWHRWSTLTEAVRRGTCVPLPQDNAPEWTRNFIAGMESHARDRAPLVVKALGTDGVRRILDLGGGSGAYSIAFAKACPGLKCEILDLPEVVPLTAGYVGKAGVSAQVGIRSGDMLENDLGSGYDLILLNAICHMFSEEQNQELFRRARRALAPHGRLAVQDFILNSDKTAPPHAVLFSLNMLVGTDAGASYSGVEYAGWMKTAGFTEVRRIRLPGPSDLIVGQVQ
jgi:(2Fe-2S) ferredoxin/predicted O-methyltransferase YrrM